MPYPKSILALFTIAAVATGLAAAGAAGQPAPLKLGQKNYVYQCSNKQKVQISYVTTGDQHASKPVFLVLTYQGQSYGLSEAVSGSGSRYIGHAGLNTASGLEWWEHHGEATLSLFKGDNASSTNKLLSCKV